MNSGGRYIGWPCPGLLSFGFMCGALAEGVGHPCVTMAASVGLHMSHSNTGNKVKVHLLLFSKEVQIELPRCPDE